MHNVLQKILKNKKGEVARQKENVPPSTLFDLINDRAKPRSFINALNSSNKVAVIAEVKKASPSAGLLRENFEPDAIAKDYQKNGAAAISVLTEQTFFQGSLDHLSAIRTEVNIPLLRKDFIFDPYQILEARAFGGDAVLLIMAILSDTQCHELKSAAMEMGLDCLIEIHTAEELEKAIEFDFGVIGINNRNLKTFEVTLKTTEVLIKSVPDKVTIVSESGYHSPAEVEWLGKLGGDAVLIGEHFMRQKDVGGALNQFTGIPKWSK